MTAWQITLLALMGIVVLNLWFRTKPEKPYIGYGWKLGWREGHVYVLSRLLKSPSGRAGVRIGSVVLEFADYPMTFESAEEFVTFTTGFLRPAVGDTQAFRILDNTGEHVMELVAEVIYPPIPYYPPLPPLSPADVHLFRHGMFYCERTGQTVHTRSLTDDAVRGLG